MVNEKLTFYNINFHEITKMDPEIINLVLSSINERLSDDPGNPDIILEKLQLLRSFPEITISGLDKHLKGLNFDRLLDKYSSHFYHAWGLINPFDEFYKRNKKYNNYHVSVIGNRIVEIWNISIKYTQMNPDRFYYIGVVFGKQLYCQKNEFITSYRKTIFMNEIKTNYSHWFHFPEVEDQYITKSLVGIEEACPICGGDEELENCVIVRDRPCHHAFHRGCIERWFSHCEKRICPFCKNDHDRPV
jgi:hypothetical protein